MLGKVKLDRYTSAPAELVPWNVFESATAVPLPKSLPKAIAEMPKSTVPGISPGITHTPKCMLVTPAAAPSVKELDTELAADVPGIDFAVYRTIVVDDGIRYSWNREREQEHNIDETQEAFH